MSRKKPSILSRLLWAGFGAAVALFGVALYLTPTAQDKLAAFFNSNFSTAFFGAVGGSLTIIAIEWFRRQRQVLADINTSIGVLTSLSTALLNMKQQHILPLVTNYSASRQKFEMTNAIRSLFPAETPFSVVTIPMYMSRFQCPELHYDVPMDRIFTHTDILDKVDVKKFEYCFLQSPYRELSRTFLFRQLNSEYEARIHHCPLKNYIQFWQGLR